MDLTKIPQVGFSENLDYNSEACIIIYPKEKFRCFDVKPDVHFQQCGALSYVFIFWATFFAFFWDI